VAQEEEVVEKKGIMEKLKEDNPNANWKNLVTGVVILLLVVVFSVWYFSSNPGGSGNGDNGDMMLDGDVEGSDTAINDAGKTIIVVQKGEGLWQVAKRVCGDGEMYNHLARANDLNIFRSELSEGQELILDCGTE
jgi:hypothetical protein